jgi:hypothetical protein
MESMIFNFICLIRRDIRMPEKLKSRKFIMAIGAAIVVLLNDGLDLGIEKETVYTFTTIVAGWILGESYVDSKRIQNGGSASGQFNINEEHQGDQGPSV